MENPGQFSVEINRACFVFNQRIVARGRIILLEMMEMILRSAPDIEICYANIDSIHFSVPSDHVEAVMSALAPKVSERMGDCKIETVARSGLWLEPGRYWLYSEYVEKFRNQSSGKRGAEFADHSIHLISKKIGDLHVPIQVTIPIDRSISDMRTIFDDPVTGLKRQQLVELKDDATIEEILSALESNRLRCTPSRLQAFRRLSSLLEKR